MKNFIKEYFKEYVEAQKRLNTKQNWIDTLYCTTVNMAIYSNNQKKFSDYLCVFDSFGFTKKINFQKKSEKILCFFAKSPFQTGIFVL